MADDIKTPTTIKGCRRLGMRGSNQKIVTSALLKRKYDENSPIVAPSSEPTKSTASRLSILDHDNINSTPTISASMPKHQSLSTANKSYRLSLNSKLREKYTKKKLNFLAASESCAPATTASDCNVESHTESDPAQIDVNTQLLQLERDIAEKQEQISVMEKHENDMAQLKSSIHVWEVGCREAMELLKTKLDPPQETEEILNHLNIPQDLIDFSN